MYLTVRIDRQYILSQVRVSVWPKKLYTRKTSNTSGKSGHQRQCLFQWPATGIVAREAGHHGWATDPPNIDNIRRRVCVRACARLHGCVMCLRYTIILFDPWRLIKLIIKIIILYFIHIRHTDDFRSTGRRTRLVQLINTNRSNELNFSLA